MLACTKDHPMSPRELAMPEDHRLGPKSLEWRSIVHDDAGLPAACDDAIACVLVDDRLQILHVYGGAGSYLELAPGPARRDVLTMARPALLTALRSALDDACAAGAPVRGQGILLGDEDRARYVDLEVIPVAALPTRGGHRGFLIGFRERRADTPAPQPPDVEAALRGEVAATKELLQQSTDEHAASSRELELANGELVGRFDALRCTNGRLERAHQELRAAIESLSLANADLRRSGLAQAQLADDLVNVLASVDVAIIIVDRERRLRRFTPRARALFNLLASDVGRAIADLRPNLEVRDLDGAIARVIATASSTDEDVAGHGGGRYRLRVHPYRSAGGDVAGAVLTVVDVSAFHGSLEDARQSRDYAAATIEAAPTPVAVLDEQCRVSSANRAFHAAFQVSPSQLSGRSFLELGTGRWRHATLANRLAAAVAGVTAFDDLEVEFEQVGGAVRTFLIGARPIAHAHRRTLVLGAFDVTERKRAEEDRVRAAEAEQAARLREALLGAVSHELRSPLNAIQLWAQVLRQPGLDDARRRRGLDTIERSVRAEVQLVDDLLELSLSARDLGAIAVQPMPVDPRPIVQTALDGIDADAARAGVALEVQFAADVPRTLADPRRLQQIASHLAGNAVKFTPAGGTVSVSLSRRGDALELRVRDTGQGIRADFLPHVFEPFARADGTLTRRHAGLGIGLALVRHLVERHGGRIDVESAGEGAGSTFTVLLPAMPGGLS
jgi:two-component system CheB/CheR fusion protein